MSSTLHRICLLAILGVAATTRLAYLDDAPPGIHHDEASNGYDGYSILETGKDRWGRPWPIVLEGFGRSDYRAALYAYLTIPFHAALGPESLTLSTRLPAATCGVLAVLCLYALVARTHDPRTGLWAALFLTLSPWHLQISRFGHESTLTTVVTIAALYLMARAGWPFRAHDDLARLNIPRERPPKDRSLTVAARYFEALSATRPKLRRIPLAAAGAVFALSFYTYPSMRFFTPALLIAGALCYRRAIVDAWRDRRDRMAIMLMVTTAGLVATPMTLLTITHWDKVMARAEQVSLFHQSVSTVDALTQSAGQYLAHFSPSWLFTQGDAYPVQAPPGYGQLSFALAPFLVAGLYTAFKQRRSNATGLLLIAWLVLHPVAASVTDHAPHALRSACGLPVFQWLAAIGCSEMVRRLGTARPRRIAVALACVLVVAVNGTVVVHDYFRGWARDPWVNALYQRDLRDAMHTVRSGFHQYDRIYISDHRSREHQWYSGEAYIIALLALPVRPDNFHTWDKSIVYERPTDGFHRVESFGPFIMTTRGEVLEHSFRQDPSQRALIIARPGDVRGGRRIRTVYGIDGRPRFEIIVVSPSQPVPAQPGRPE